MSRGVSFTGRLFLTLLCTYFAYRLFTVTPPWIFIDGANLMIHEGGHFIFAAFGQFISILGGSLTQILVPCIFFFYFLLRKEFFAVSAMLFWIGDNIIGVATYMKDAQAMTLPLLGGDNAIHDWNWLFRYMGVLNVSEVIGTAFFTLGVITVVTGILGMATFTFLSAVED